MKAMSKIETSEAPLRPSVTQLVANLRRTAAALQAAVCVEEERSGCSDPGAPAYSLLARSMRTRLINLNATIAVLEAAEPLAAWHAGFRARAKDSFQSSMS